MIIGVLLGCRQAVALCTEWCWMLCCVCFTFSVVTYSNVYLYSEGHFSLLLSQRQVESHSTGPGTYVQTSRRCSSMQACMTIEV